MYVGVPGVEKTLQRAASPQGSTLERKGNGILPDPTDDPM
jgi:hypothetical protein